MLSAWTIAEMQSMPVGAFDRSLTCTPAIPTTMLDV